MDVLILYKILTSKFLAANRYIKDRIFRVENQCFIVVSNDLFAPSIPYVNTFVFVNINSQTS